MLTSLNLLISQPTICYGNFSLSTTFNVDLHFFHASQSHISNMFVLSLGVLWESSILNAINVFSNQSTFFHPIYVLLTWWSSLHTFLSLPVHVWLDSEGILTSNLFNVLLSWVHPQGNYIVTSLASGLVAGREGGWSLTLSCEGKPLRCLQAIQPL